MTIEQEQIKIQQKLNDIQNLVEDRINQGIDDNIDIIEDLLNIQRDWYATIEKRIDEMSNDFQKQIKEVSKYADHFRR